MTISLDSFWHTHNGGLYMYLYVYLRRRVKALNIGLPRITTRSRMNLCNEFHDLERSSETDGLPIKIICNQPLKPSFETQYHPSSVITPHPQDRQKHLSKILLLNAYPIAYIMLWIPGLCNRLVEASGHTSKVLQILQASTQFVGFANALTYGWNESVAKSIKEMVRRSSSWPRIDSIHVIIVNFAYAYVLIWGQYYITLIANHISLEWRWSSVTSWEADFPDSPSKTLGKTGTWPVNSGNRRAGCPLFIFNHKSVVLNKACSSVSSTVGCCDAKKIITFFESWNLLIDVFQ